MMAFSDVYLEIFNVFASYVFLPTMVAQQIKWILQGRYFAQQNEESIVLVMKVQATIFEQKSKY